MKKESTWDVWGEVATENKICPRQRHLKNIEMAVLNLTCNLAASCVIAGVSYCQKIQTLWKVLW